MDEIREIKNTSSISGIINSKINSAKNIIANSAKSDDNIENNQEDTLLDQSELTEEEKSPQSEDNWFANIFSKIGNFFSNIFSGIFDFFANLFGENEDKEDVSYSVNGELDKEVKQGQLGDCVLISTLYSMAQNEQGAEILKDAITINQDEKGNVESYSVTFKGIDETVTITKDELDLINDDNWLDFYNKNGYAYSKGDDDMLLLEIAWQKVNEQAGDKIANLKSNTISIHSRDEKGPTSLNAVNNEKLIKAFTNADFENSSTLYHNLMQKAKYSYYYDNGLLDELENFEGEFHISDLGISEITITKHKITFSFNKDDTYTIQKVENSSSFLIKNTKDETEIELEYSDFIKTCMSETDELESQINKKTLQIIKEFNPDIMLFNTYSNNKYPTLTTVNGEEKTIIGCHVYSIKEITDDTITIVNPWNTGEELVFSIDEFTSKRLGDITYVNID